MRFKAGTTVQTPIKPSQKKRAVDKDFRVKKPRIKPKTGDWMWESPYHHQEYKDEFIEGP